MKRFFLVMILSLLVLVPAVRADGPDDQYVGIYNLIQQGDVLNEKGQVGSARAKYEDALAVLKKFQKAFPDWNVKVVRYRVNYLTAKITELSPQLSPLLPPPTAPATTPPVATSKPAPIVVPLTPAPAKPAPVVSNPPPKISIPIVPAAETKPVTKPVEATPPPAVTVVPTPTPVAPVVVPPIAKEPVVSTSSDPQINILQEQVHRLERDKVVLESKLKEALAARPAASDPQELARTQELVKELQKENDLLKTSLTQARENAAHPGPASVEQARKELSEANRKVAQLTDANASLSKEKEMLQARVKALSAPDAVTQALREENQILKKQVADLRAKSGSASPNDDVGKKLLEAQSQLAVLQSDKELLRLEKLALESRYKEATKTNIVRTVSTPDPATLERIKRLELQREELQKNLDAALKEIAGHKKGKDTTARVEQMTEELAALHSRLDALEAKKVPYTAEELALFNRPPAELINTNTPAAAKRSVKELPANAAVMIAEGKRYFASRQFDKAEEKYKEVLKLNDRNVSTLSDLASIELEMNHFADAERNIKAALVIEPDNDYALMVLGHVKFEEANYDEALTAFSQAAKLNPQNAEIQNFLGITLSEKGLRGPAETALRRAVQIDPNYASAHINLAFVYVLQKPPLVELARWHYQKALASNHPRDLKLEKLLDPMRTANAAP